MSEEFSLENFVFEGVLGDNPETRSLAIKGRWKDESERPGAVVLVLEKVPFVAEDVKHLAKDVDTLSILTDNDVFKSFLLTSTRKEVNQIRCTYMYPADEGHIRKYTWRVPCFLEETPEIYEKISKPYILEHGQKNLKWIHNILDGKSEIKGRLYDDSSNLSEGFVLLPDYKWDQRNTNKLYCLAIVAKRDLLTLRDLTTEHLPLLTHMKERILQAVFEYFNIPADNIRMFVHYHPTYYHFHVHVIHTNMFIGGYQTCKAHALSDVIDNIHLNPLYYRQRSLGIEMSADNPLLEQIYKFKDDLRTSI